MIARYLKRFIKEDLAKKMVFLAGPRQVGKTILAKLILEEAKKGAYYNWDTRIDRLQLLKTEWPADVELVVIDELHKYRHWKRWIKGEHDRYHDQFRFLITGSARMDIYRKGGDSLQGRYHHYRLHPFSLAELMGHLFTGEVFSKIGFKNEGSQEILDRLFVFGGFPEPYLEQKERHLRRWHHERMDRIIREDVRDLENVRDISSLEILAELLFTKAANLLSLNSLREDLEVSHKAITHWVNIFERLYYIFRLYPYTGKAIRSLKKEAKVYLWDYSMISNKAAKFENLLACHLLKFCHFLKDVQGYRAQLYYLRDVDKREVDFLITIDEKPWFAIEAKLSEESPVATLGYFASRLKIPYLYQVVLNGKRDFIKDRIRVIPALKFLANLV